MGFLDNLFPNKKEKIPKSDKNKRPASHVSRAPARPAPQPPTPNEQQQQAPSTTASIFGSLRRFRDGVATSVPKKVDRDENKNKNKGTKKTDQSEAASTATVDGTTANVDANANVDGLISANKTVETDARDKLNERVSVRRRGKENVEQHWNRVDSKERPESKVVITSGRGQEKLKKDKVKSSRASLNNILRLQPKSTQSQQPKPKRPVTLALPSNVTVRRGHKEGQGHQDNVSRTSSVTNLDSLEANLQAQQGKGAKPRKVASKERIDKQTQDGKKVSKNNNKLEPPLPPTGQSLSYSSDSLQEAEIQLLKKQLREMSDEKSSLALQLGEQRGQLNVLQKEIQKLKDDSNLEMDKLAEENTALRNRLRDVAHSPLSDNEKQQLLFESRHHNSAPASIATNVVDDNGGDATACTTPDWDKHSSGNVSQISVACLQDKINQMQETHYSTNEELQATLQELTDLQRQLTELQQENERLNEEKTLMFDSLCRQTERLNDSRQEVENLKQLLYRDRSDETGVNQLESVVEREQKLVELLRSAQEEREQLILKLEQIQAELQDSRAEHIEKSEVLTQQSERVKTLECTLDAKHAEHKQLDQELAQAKDQCSGKQIEINRLTDLLENARTKIIELEQDRTLSDKSELDELLDNARKEKDQLESEVAYLKEQLARSKNEIEKLKEQVFVLQEECKVTRNNAKTTQSDLEYKCEKLVTEKNTLGEQLQQFQEAVNELQVQAQCHLEDKRQLSAVLSETQRNLSEAERRNLNLETEIQELKKLRAEENDEWEKFQNDLLTSVRVANDFKTEAQQELQKIILENKTYREKLRLLEGQVEKLKGEKISSSTQTDIILTPQLISLAKNLDQSIPNRLSLLEHPIPPTSLGSGSPTTPTSSMDKLFPILSRDRRSKSKENLSDASYKTSESSVRRSRSKDNLSSLEGSKKSSIKIKRKEKPVTVDEPRKENNSFLKRNKSNNDNLVEPPKPVDEPSKTSWGFLKRNKSKDNLEQFAEVDNGKSKKEESNKGSKSFLKRNKSKDDLKQVAAVESGRSKNEEDSGKKETGVVDKPRKSLDSIDSSSSSSKSDFSKPEFFSKFIKKRDKKLLSHRKTMSVEEGMLLKSLDNWYGNIDQNIPDEYLSKEDQAVKKLKILYENEHLKERPVAHKPKEQLAISKPLLNSVVQNPKLNEIVRNPQVPTVETQVRESALEDTFSLINAGQEVDTSTDGPRFRIGSAEIYTNIGPKSLGIHKCQSLDDLNVFEEYRTESELDPVLYGAVETDNLATEEHLEIKSGPRYDRMSSDIHPNDSVSNPRYSTRYHDVPLKEYVPNELPKPNIYINYENLDEIVDKLPKGVLESKLTEEQKFALKLKLALDEAEKKNTLKKIKKKKKSVRGLEISEPTPESVQKNWKLKEIMLNPTIKKAEEAKKDKFFLDLFKDTDKKRHSTDISSDIGELEILERRPSLIKANSMISKSYEDISFSFVPENTLLHMYYGKKDQHGWRPKITSDTSSSSQSFTSAEFNLDTGKITQKWDIPTKMKVEQEIVRQKDEAIEATEDLLYNETINKEKNKKRNKQKQVGDDLEYKESVEQLKRDLSPTKGNTSPLDKNRQGEKNQELWMKGSLERYKKDLNQIVKQIDSDQLRDSIRRRGYQTSNFETNYQVAQTETDFYEYKIEIYNESPHENEHVEENHKYKQNLVDQPAENFGPHEKEEVNKNDEDTQSLVIQPAENFGLHEKEDVKENDKDTQILVIQPAENFGPHEKDVEENYEDTQSLVIEPAEIFGRQNETNFVENLDTETISENTLGGETVDEAINLSILSDTLRDFILNERMFSDGYNVDVQQNRMSNKRNFEISFTGPADTETQIQTSNLKENQLDSFSTEIVKDAVEVRDQVPHVLDDRRSLTVKEEQHSGRPDFEPVPKERNRVTLSFYDIRFQSPVEVTTGVCKADVLNSDQSIPLIKNSESAERENVSITPDNMPDQNPIEMVTHENKTSPIIPASDGVNKNVNNESELTVIENDIIEPEKPILFPCPTGLMEVEALVPEEIDSTDVWPAPDEKDDFCDIDAVDQPDVPKIQNLTTYHKNIDDERSQTIIEDITYQFPSTSTEATNLLDIKEIIEDDLDGGISHSGLFETTTYQPNDENMYSFNLVNTPAPQTAEINKQYSYKETLKENQDGVVSPLDLRYTYRGVVKEYKEKFPTEHTEDTDEANGEGSDVSDLEYNEGFIDEFFKPPEGFKYELGPEIRNIDHHVAETGNVVELLDIKAPDTDITNESIEIRRREEAVSQIDKEMQNIMEKYLHTRSSLIIKKTGVDVENKEKVPELKGNLKKYGNSENLNEIDSSEFKINNEETKHLDVIQPTVSFENEDISAWESDNGKDDEPLSLEDLKFIEEMKARYSSTDNVSTISEKSTDLPNITEEEIEYKYQHLTNEELQLLRSAKRDRDSRPLSDINARDLLLIDEISRRYFKDSSLPPSVRSSVQEEKEVPKLVIEEGKQIKENVTLFGKVFEINVDKKENEITPPLPLSLPPKSSTEYRDQPDSYKEYKDIENADNPSILTSSQSDSLLGKEVIKEEKTETSKNENTVQTIEQTSKSTIDKSKETKISHLPPSLRPKNPTANQPIISYQQHSNVLFRDKNKLSRTQGLPNRPTSSADRSSSKRLSDLIFNETIFVPVAKDEMIGNSPKSPLSPGYKHIEGGTWRNHEKPDFRQTIVVPSPRKVGSLNAGLAKEVTSPSPKSPVDHSFRETLLIPSTTVEPKERPESIITSRNKSGNLGFKETIIIPAKQRPTSYSWEKQYTSKDPPKLIQSETKVTTINKPGYHSYSETIIVPKPQESPEAKDQNSEALSLQKSVTQSKNGSTYEVKVNFNRYSAIPKPIASTTTIRTSERRSFLEPFTTKSLGGGVTSYEPVYSNVNFSTTTRKEVFSSNIKKKPFPVPRLAESTPQTQDYLAGTSSKLDRVNSKHDSFINMTDSNPNLSEILANKETVSFTTTNRANFAQLQAKILEGAALKPDKITNLAAEEIVVLQEKNVPSDKVILVESKAETDILNNKKLFIESKESTESSKSSQKSDGQNATTETLNTRGMADNIGKDEQSIALGGSSTVRSAASIAVTTKGEQLDITKTRTSADYVLEEDIEDVARKSSGEDISNVNLFTMDSHSSYDSYLEMFKTKESKDFDDLRGKKSPIKNFLGMAGFAYVEEQASEDVASDDAQEEGKPKIVDFVPLDDDTTPYFTKDDKETYDTLEREKTFHVLGQASKISDKLSSGSAKILRKKDDAAIVAEKDKNKQREENNLEGSLEILSKKSSGFSKASSKSQTDTSRTSFTQAKKLFEALVEANKDERPKTAVPNKSPVRHSVRDSRSMDQMRTRGSVSKESEVPALGETGLLIKDRAQEPEK